MFAEPLRDRERELARDPKEVDVGSKEFVREWFLIVIVGVMNNFF